MYSIVVGRVARAPESCGGAPRRPRLWVVSATFGVWRCGGAGRAMGASGTYWRVRGVVRFTRNRTARVEPSLEGVGVLPLPYVCGQSSRSSPPEMNPVRRGPRRVIPSILQAASSYGETQRCDARKRGIDADFRACQQQCKRLYPRDLFSRDVSSNFILVPYRSLGYYFLIRGR